jgi:hypothetical protein
MVGPAAMREGVAHLRTVFEISERRACSIIKMSSKWCGADDNRGAPRLYAAMR